MNTSTKKYKKPVSREVFETKTALLLDVIAENVVVQFENEYKQTLTKEQREWSVNHADVRIRWFYANDKKWYKKLNNKTNVGRDYCYMFVAHWLKAFMMNNEQYKKRHGVYDE